MTVTSRRNSPVNYRFDSFFNIHSPLINFLRKQTVIMNSQRRLTLRTT